MEFNLGFIGGGNMSTGIVKGILKSGVHSASKIWVSGPHIESLKHWSDMGINVSSENGVVFDNCNMIFLGVKVNKLQDAIQDIKLTSKNTSKEVQFISMLAGVQIKELRMTIESHLSGVRASIIRIMPNTPMTVGAGICLYTPDSTVTQPKCLILEELLSGSALCEKVPEEYMDSLGALTGCGPAYMYLVIEALADGAVKQGVPRAMAMRHAAQMVVGSGQMVLQTGKHPGLLKDEVCSPGGSTIAGVHELENGKLRASLINAVQASTIKNKELGKK